MIEMSRKEAIGRIQEHIRIHSKKEPFTPYLDKAFDMAIEALNRPHGECRTCMHFVRGGLDGKTYVCEHPDLEQDDYFNYAFINMEATDFCSRYEKEEGDNE